MSNQNKLNILERRKLELIKNIQLCEQNRERIIRFIQKLHNQYKQRLISYSEYYSKFNNTLKQRTPQQWIKYYDECLEYYKCNLNICKEDIIKEQTKTKAIPLLITLSMLMILGIGLFFIKTGFEKPITGLIIYQEGEIINDTLILNIPENITINESVVIVILNAQQSELPLTEFTILDNIVTIELSKFNIVAEDGTLIAQIIFNNTIINETNLEIKTQEVGLVENISEEINVSKEEKITEISENITEEEIMTGVNLSLIKAPKIKKEYKVDKNVKRGLDWEESCNNEKCIRTIVDGLSNYLEKDEYLPIDLDIVSSEGEFDYEVTHNFYKAYFNFNSFKGFLVKTGFDDKYISYKLEDMNNVNSVIEGNKITYKNIYDNIDLEYIVLPTKLKERFILYNYSKDVFIFRIKTEGVDYRESNGNIDFYDENGIVFSLIKPYMYDNTFGNENEDKDSLSNNINYNLKEAGNNLFVDIILDKEWLKNAKYPVIIDPITIYYPNTTNGGDTYVHSRYGTTNYGTDTIIDIGTDNNGAGRWHHGLILWDLSSIPSGSTVNDANISLYCVTETGTADVDLHNITESWGETTATWNTRDGSTPWTTAGGTYDSTIIASQATIASTTWAVFKDNANIEQLVQAWINGNTVNNGILGKKNSETDFTNNCQFSSDDNTNKPMLIIDYTLPLNSPPNSPSPIINSTLGTNLTSEDLHCSFTPTDNDAGETLFANISWLKNNITNLTLTSISVTQNSLYVSDLESENTTENDLWNCQAQICDDEPSCSAWVNSSQLKIRDIIGPVIILNAPIDRYNTSSPSLIIFNTTVYDDINLTNVTLWGNWTNAFIRNETNSSGINNTDYIFNKNLNIYSNGYYLWGIEACDSSNNCNYSSNRTFLIDTIAPDLIVTNPTNNSNFSSSGVNLNFTVTDLTIGVSSCWYELNSSRTNVSINNCNNVTLTNLGDGRLNITMWVNDTLNNVNQSGIIFFTIDTTAPVISNTDVNETSIMQNDYVRVNCTATDSGVGIDKFLIEADKPTSANQNYTTTLLSGDTYYSDIQLTEAGTWWFNCWVNDTLNNLVNKSDGSVIVTSANTAPNAPSSLVINSTSTVHTNYTTEDLAMNFLCDDPDTGDTLTFHLTAFRNGTNQFQLESGCNDPEYKQVILNNLNTTRGDNWSFSVNISDSGGLYSNTISSVVNLTIRNSDPVITFVSLNDSRTIIEGGIRQIEFSFIANDTDGTSDLDDTSAKGNVSRGIENSINNSCVNNGIVSGGNNYTCTVQIQYWYDAGSWNVGTEIRDNSGILVQNNSRTFFLQELIGMNVSSTSLTWPSVIPSGINQTSNNDPISLHNTGNKDTLDIFVQGIDLYEDAAGVTYIPTANFTVFNATSAGNKECDIKNKTSAVTYGGLPILLGNNTDVAIVTNSLPRSSTNIESLYFCLYWVPSSLSSATYSTTNSTANSPNEEDWTISIQ